MLRRYAKGFKERAAEVRMLHVGFGSNFWHPLDILFVVTGWVWK
jgi:hypothetical protein